MSDARCNMIDPVRDTDSIFSGHCGHPFFRTLRGTVPLGVVVPIPLMVHNAPKAHFWNRRCLAKLPTTLRLH